MIAMSGVAIAEPPTPKNPVNDPTAAPASTNHGQVATLSRYAPHPGRASGQIRISAVAPAVSGRVAAGPRTCLRTQVHDPGREGPRGWPSDPHRPHEKASGLGIGPSGRCEGDAH